jgi:hypothetical protein
MRWSKERTEALCRAYVRGAADEQGRLVYPSMPELAEAHHCGVRVISSYVKRFDLKKQREEYRKAWTFERSRAELTTALSEHAKANGTDISLARLLSQHVLKVFADAQATEQSTGKATPLTPGNLDLLAKVVERAQRVRRLAYGLATSIVEQKSKAESELEELRAKAEVVAAGGASPEQLQREIEQCAKLEPKELIRVLGLVPKKGNAK